MKKIEKLEMIGISKSFHGVLANNNVNISIKSGEILGLLGENGAGKTTLMNILYGLYQPDSGHISINNKGVDIRSPMDSIESGIGMVHQHFMLIQNHSVVENITIGYKQTPMFFPQRRMHDKIIEFSKMFNFDIDPLKQVWQLSAGEQQRVEIIKALINGAALLILDEPTSVLTPQEINDLFRTLREMKKAGHLIILISHKLDEIFEICDKVVVLQKGDVVGDVDIKDVDKKELARMMVGREVIFNITKEKLPRTEKVLRLKNVIINGDKGYPTVNGISFEVFKNEIFGIAGVSGNGQKELVEGITGLRKIESGKIEIKGADITNKSARCIYDNGVSHVPEERIKFGIAPGLCLYENSILKQHHRNRYRSKLLLAYQRIKDHASDLINKFSVSAPSIHVQTKNLSGGNIQKLILGREISESPELLVASHPTYGLDVGATEYLRRQLLDQTKAGGAVLLVSEDLEELFELCDRIAVIFRGKFMGILEPDDPRISDIGLMMAGSMNVD